MSSSDSDRPVRWYHLALVLLSLWWLVGMPLASQSNGLDALADTATVEHARCLYGTSVPDGTVTFLWTVEPEIDSSTTTAIVVKACPGIALAFWHNHLKGWKPAFVPGGAVFVAGTPADSACYMSQQDILSAIRPLSPPMQVVQAGSGVRCWWTKLQIVRLAIQPNGMALFLRPLEGQP